MDVLDALIETAEELGWSATMLGATAGLSEGAARKWLDRKAVPGGDTLVVLMREMPGLRERLGFQLVAA